MLFDGKIFGENSAETIFFSAKRCKPYVVISRG
jgi:hypothetical protein